MSYNLYSANDVRPVHALRYDWTAWFDLGAGQGVSSAASAGEGASRGVVTGSDAESGVCRVAFPNLGPTGSSPVEAGRTGSASHTQAARHGACPRGGEIEAAIAACRPFWLADGLEAGLWQLLPDGGLQVLFTVAPHVSPAVCAARAKGRLDHALRHAWVAACGVNHAPTGTSPAAGLAEDADPRRHRPCAGGAPIATGGAAPFRFRRTVSVRTLGDNTRETVDSYVARQAAKSDYVDPRFKTFLDQFNAVQPTVSLAQPQATGHGRY